MKVIFTDTVKGVAFKGDVRTVKPGHFRNYLLPQGKAVVATPHTLGLWNKKRSEFLMEKEQVERQAVEVKERLASIALTIEKKVTTKGTLYSAITEKDIVDALRKQAKMAIDPTSISLKEQIKSVGSFEVPIRLASNLEGTVLLNVVAKPE
ncbi:MAG: 50S ribosomal protein L9 [Patescibacteria group bacterium]